MAEVKDINNKDGKLSSFFHGCFKLVHLEKFYDRYEPIIMYIIFGGLTTVIDFTVYITSTRILANLDSISPNLAAAFGNEQVAQWLSWFFAVLFAFITNRIWVFKAHRCGLPEFFYQITSFYGSRLFSGFVNWLMIFVFVTEKGFNDIIIKIIASIVVLILNYILSKLIVFKNRKPIRD